MKRTYLGQLFTLIAILLLMAAAAVLQAPGKGTLQKAYLLNLRSVGDITRPINQWSNAYAFNLIAGDGTPAKLGLGLMVAGGLGVALALYFSYRPAENQSSPATGTESVPPPTTAEPEVAPPPSAPINRDRPKRIHWLPLLIGAALLWILAEINGNLLNIEFLQTHNVHVQSAMFFFGVTLVTVSFLDVRGLLRWRLNAEWATVLGITLLALIVRLWKLGTAIHGLVDEMHFINAITRLWATPNDIPILQPFSTIPAFPWVFPYLQWATVELAGNNLTAIRLISVVMGTLTVPALYLLTRSLFDKTTALCAALILATFPPHVHFSRAGLNNIADPLFGTAAFAFLAYGLQSRRQWPFALAGISLGLTQYFYDAGRLIYPALALAWLIFAGLFHLMMKSSLNSPSTKIDAQTQSPAAPIRTSWRRPLIIFFMTFFLIAAPVYYTRIGMDESFSPRAEEVSAGNDFWRTVLVGQDGELIYLRHLAYTFFIYVYMPEMSWFYGGNTPLVLHILVPIFLFGLFYAAWKFRNPGPLLVILWIVVVALGNTLLRESATAARYVVVLPVLALLMAIGLRQAVPLLLADFWSKKAQVGLIVALVILIAAGQTRYYFAHHIEDWNNGRLSLDADDAMFRAAELPPGTHVHIINEIEILRFNVETMQTFLKRPDLVTDAIYPKQFTGEYLANLPRDVPHAFFLPPDDYEMLVLLVRHFEIEPPAYSPYNVPREWQFVLYVAPLELNQSSPSGEQWLKQ